MLAKANRLRTAAEFRQTVRRGKKVSGHLLTATVLNRAAGEPARLGFVVSKRVGSAVTRNLVRRRLRAISRELIDDGLSGVDVVVRVDPSAADADWVELQTELKRELSFEAAK